MQTAADYAKLKIKFAEAANRPNTSQTLCLWILSTLLLFLILKGTVGRLPLTEFFEPRVPVKIENAQAADLGALGRLQISDAPFLKIAAGGLDLPFEITGIANLYEIKKGIADFKIKAVSKTAGNVPQIAEVELVPDYRGYSNSEETRLKINALGRWPVSGENFNGEFELSLENASGRNQPLAAIRLQGFAPEFLSRLPAPLRSRAGLMAPILIAALLILNTVTLLIETKIFPTASAVSILKITALAFLSFVSHQKIARILGPWTLAAAFGVALPWGMILYRSSHWRPAAEKIQTLFESARAWKSKGSKQKIYFNILISLTLLLFALLLFSGRAFRWGVFEERDFLIAREVARLNYFPVLGPQNLAGGQIPGGFLYLLLASVHALWPAPAGFAFFTRLLYLGSALLLVRILKRSGLIAAAAGVLFFCTSQTVIAYAHWPIHPSMSLFFYFLFIDACLGFFVDGKPLALIASALLLSILIQMHFSYIVLLVPFSALLILSPIRQKRWLIPLTLAAFLILFLPYAGFEITHHAANLKLILAKPRFHANYVPLSPLFSARILELLLGWFDNVAGAIGQKAVAVELFLFLCGLISCAAAVSPPESSKKSRARFKTAVTFLFGLPLIIFVIYGMGYDYRHTIAFAPLGFVIAGLGAERLSRLSRGKLDLPLVATLAVLSLFFLGTAADQASVKKILPRAGEWAVDYDERTRVTEILITKHGLTPEEYERQVYWWWYSWAASPELYRDEFLRHRGRQRGHEREILKPGENLLLLSAKPLPLFEKAFELKPIESFQSITLYRAASKDRSPPASNTRNICRLTPLEQAVETLEVRDGLSKLQLKQSGGLSSVTLLSLHHGRIKLLLDLQTEKRMNRTFARWKIISPHLSGYYQEIKTLWKPVLTFAKREGTEMRVPLAPAVLGDLLHKTPVEGETDLGTDGGDLKVSLSVEGYFDQSDMMSPRIGTLVWNLDGARELAAVLDAEQSF